MSFSLGDPDPQADSGEQPREASAPRATRATARRLRDPRMWIGVLLVAVSALAGGRVLAVANSTVEVWSAGRDLPRDATIALSDLVSTSVHFSDSDTIRSYVPVARSLLGHQLAQPLEAGQLIPAAAVGSVDPPVAELPLGVAAADLPADLAAGDRVDVYALPDDQQSNAVTDVSRVVRGIRVLDVAAPEISAAGGQREVLLAVDPTADLRSVLGALVGARPVLIRVGA
jgi:hypothetical protein